MTEEKKEEKTEKLEPNMINSFGKEFDVNDPVQKAQYTTWEEAMRMMQGKQSNEVGELRKFKKKFEPAADTNTLIQKVKELDSEDNTEGIVELLLASQAKMFSDFETKNEVRDGNAKLWTKYFSQRPELLKTFDQDMIRTYSEESLPMFDVEDSFAVLDAYWGPKSKAKQEFEGATPVDTSTSTADVQAGTRTAAEPKNNEPEVPALDDILGSVKY